MKIMGGWRNHKENIGKGRDRTDLAKSNFSRSRVAEDFWLQRTITTIGVANGASAAAMAAAIAQDLILVEPAFPLFRLFLVGAIFAGAVPALLLWRNYFPAQKDDDPSEVLYGSKLTQFKRRVRSLWWQIRHFLPWIFLTGALLVLAGGLLSLRPEILAANC